MNVTELIEQAEKETRLAFKTFDAQSAALRALHKPLSDDPSLGELLVKATTPSPIGEHAKLEATFSKSITKALQHIDEGLKQIHQFELTANYLEGGYTPPTDPVLRQYAEQVKAAAQLGLGSVDPVLLSRDITRNITSAKTELERVKSVWAERTKSAMVVALRGKRFLLAASTHAPDRHLQEAKLHAVRTMHEKRFGAFGRRGGAR